jgi:acyl-CoA thioesterase-2
MNDALKVLLGLMDLEELEVNIFRGRSPQEERQRVFGGQVLGQALVAAIRTVDDESRIAHSMHGYFLRPGDPNIPILYDVDRIRDGKSFTTRRVVAIQHGRAIFNMSVSFHREEPGLEHQIEMPDTPAPESLPSFEERVTEHLKRFPEHADEFGKRGRPIEQRFVDHDGLMASREKRQPYHRVWLKATDALPDDLALHQCVLAYASDLTLLDSSILPHGITFGPELQRRQARRLHDAGRPDPRRRLGGRLASRPTPQRAGGERSLLISSRRGPSGGDPRAGR